MNSLLKEYYGKRASEYESIYDRDDSTRQEEIKIVKERLKKIFENKSVLEVACGTGYWSKSISETSSRITGVDFSKEVIEIAKSKKINAEFIVDDAYSLEKIDGKFDGGCALFWFSHIPKARLNDFLKIFHSKLEKGSYVFLADNVYIEGIGGQLIKKNNEYDTYKKRKLNDGSTYEIIKNYYTKNELEKIIQPYAKQIDITIGKCFWWLNYLIN